jgi:hypothetical protein
MLGTGTGVTLALLDEGATVVGTGTGVVTADAVTVGEGRT